MTMEFCYSYYYIIPVKLYMLFLFAVDGVNMSTFLPYLGNLETDHIDCFTRLSHGGGLSKNVILIMQHSWITENINENIFNL